MGKGITRNSIKEAFPIVKGAITRGEKLFLAVNSKRQLYTYTEKDRDKARLEAEKLADGLRPKVFLGQYLIDTEEVISKLNKDIKRPLTIETFAEVVDTAYTYNDYDYKRLFISPTIREEFAKISKSYRKEIVTLAKNNKITNEELMKYGKPVTKIGNDGSFTFSAGSLEARYMLYDIEMYLIENKIREDKNIVPYFVKSFEDNDFVRFYSTPSKLPMKYVKYVIESNEVTFKYYNKFAKVLIAELKLKSK